MLVVKPTVVLLFLFGTQLMIVQHPIFVLLVILNQMQALVVLLVVVQIN